MLRPTWPAGLASILAVLVLTALPALSLGQSGAPGPLEVDGDRGARLGVEVPPGAAPAGTTVTVVPRAPGERPVELMAVPMTSTFFELQPPDVRFGAPVTVTRWISFEELGLDSFDPVFDGVVVASLLTRDAAGAWAWLAAPEVRLDLAEEAFRLTATTDHGGPVITSVTGDVLVATEDDAPTPTGAAFRVEGQLRVDPASRADIVGVTGRTSDETIATAGQRYDVEAFERAAGLEYQCLAPGTVRYETTFSVGEVGDVDPVTITTGLPGTAVAVTHASEHTCG